MLIDRRIFLTGSITFLGLSGCGDSNAVLSVSAQGSAGMNPGPDGVDRAVTLNILQMRGSGAFDSADYYALQDPSAALGAEFVRADQIALAPGGTANKAITLQPDTSVVGVVAGFRDPAGKQFRGKISAPKSKAELIIMVGSGGIKLQMA